MSMKQPFLELNRILEALRMQDLGPALEYACLSYYTIRSACYLFHIFHPADSPDWVCFIFPAAPHAYMFDSANVTRWAVTNRQRLLDLNSSLEFKLHRLYFISLLSGGIGKQMEALQYARHFQPFASQHQRGRQTQTPQHSRCELTNSHPVSPILLLPFPLKIFRSSWAVWYICAMASRTLHTAACWRPTSGLRSVTSSPGMPVPYWAFL